MSAGARDLSTLRVLVVHDWMLAWAGAERVLAEIMRVVPQADLVVGSLAPKLRELNEVTRRARETWLARLPLAHTNHRWLLPFQYPAFAGIDTRGYDLVISSSNAFTKAVRMADGKPHVSYCHSPPRYLWDMRRVYQSQVGAVSGAALMASTPVLRYLDRRSATRVSHFVSNSRFVAERIRNVYGRESVVIYPPVEAKAASGVAPARREDFLLSLGRLVPYKRVDLAIRAAERLGVRLIVAGDGPERQALTRIAGPRTEFLGEVDERTAADLLNRCRAFVFCAEEDFGIAPVEANAHGAPVIAYGRGALLESMTTETAVFFDRPELDALVQAARTALERNWNAATLRANAGRFSPAVFRERFAAVLRTAVDPEGSVSEESRSTGS